MARYPTPWQRQILWAAITGASLLLIAAITVYVLKITGDVLSFLQPLLIPVAVAGVLAYLLEPVVVKLGKWGMPRTRAVISVFALVTLSASAILVWIIPEVHDQSLKLSQKLPRYTQTVRSRISDFASKHAAEFGLPVPAPEVEPPALEDSPATDGQAATSQPAKGEYAPYVVDATEWLQQEFPSLVQQLFGVIRKSVGGFLGVFGFLLSLVLVPVYLFFFLKEGPNISAHWSEYIPLKASRFKSELVDTLSEINGYLINFFRGQLLVSLIDGALTGVALLVVGLDFALLIGLMVGVLGLIPYIGIILCWVPAVLIAAVQWPGEWYHPLLVTGIFVAVQQIDGLFIAPRSLATRLVCIQ